MYFMHFICSRVYSFTGSGSYPFTCFIRSFIHPFFCSFVCSVILSFIRSFIHSSFIFASDFFLPCYAISVACQPCFTSQPQHSLLLHLTGIPIGYWFLIASLLSRNFRPGAAEHNLAYFVHDAVAMFERIAPFQHQQTLTEPGLETIGQRLEWCVAQCFREVGISVCLSSFPTLNQTSSFWLSPFWDYDKYSASQLCCWVPFQLNSFVVGKSARFFHWLHAELKPRYVNTSLGPTNCLQPVQFNVSKDSNGFSLAWSPARLYSLLVVCTIQPSLPQPDFVKSGGLSIMSSPDV